MRRRTSYAGRDQLSGQPLVPPDGSAGDEPDLGRDPGEAPLLELGAVGEQDRIAADDAVEGGKAATMTPGFLEGDKRRLRGTVAP